MGVKHPGGNGTVTKNWIKVALRLIIFDCRTVATVTRLEHNTLAFIHDLSTQYRALGQSREYDSVF